MGPSCGCLFVVFVGVGAVRGDWVQQDLAHVRGEFLPFETCALGRNLQFRDALTVETPQRITRGPAYSGDCEPPSDFADMCSLVHDGRGGVCAPSTAAASHLMRWEPGRCPPSSEGDPGALAAILSRQGFKGVVLWGDSTALYDFQHGFLCSWRRSNALKLARQESGATTAVAAGEATAATASLEEFARAFEGANAGIAGMGAFKTFTAEQLCVHHGNGSSSILVALVRVNLLHEVPAPELQAALDWFEPFGPFVHVFNEGLHVHEPSAEAHLAAVAPVIDTFSAWLARHPSSLGVWRETYAQHFGAPTGDGTFDHAAEVERRARGCAGAVVEQSDKEVAVLAYVSRGHPHMAVVRTFDYASTRGDLKMGRKIAWTPAAPGAPPQRHVVLDCTHTCFSPFFSEVLLGRIGEAVGAEQSEGGCKGQAASS